MDIIAKKYRDLKKRYRKLRNAYNKYRHMVHYKDKEQPPKPEYKKIKSELNPFFDQENSVDNHMFKYPLEYLDIEDIKKMFITTRSLVKHNIFILKKNIDFSERNIKEEIKNGDVRRIIINFHSTNENFVINFINNKEIIEECFNNVTRIDFIIDGVLNSRQLKFSYFRNLISLEFKIRFEGYLDILDLSNLSKLRFLNIPKNILIKELVLSGCSAIKRLDITGHQINSIPDLSGCTALEHFNVSNNRLERISLSDLPNLKYLYISKNKILEVILIECATLEHRVVQRRSGVVHLQQ